MAISSSALLTYVMEELLGGGRGGGGEQGKHVLHNAMRGTFGFSKMRFPNLVGLVFDMMGRCE